MANQIVLDLTGVVNSRSVASGSNLDETNLQHRHHVEFGQNGAADAAAATRVVYRAYKPSTVLVAYVTPDVVPTGGTKTMTVDVKKSTAGGAWASILTATTTLDGTAVARTPVALSLSGSPALIAGDLLQIVITVGGSGGSGVQGFMVEIVVTENGQ
jgi:hypothetical protein